MIAGGERAEELRRLAALLRAGFTAREALERWRPAGEGRDRLPTLLRLGIDIPTAMGCLGDLLGADLGIVRTAVTISLRNGADLPAMLDSIAAAVERRAAERQAARSAGAGALLSARMIGALPLIVVVLMPVSGRLPTDALGLALVAAGAALGLWGIAWIECLSPRPPATVDEWAALADLLGATAAGGGDPLDALELVASPRCEGFPDLAADRRRAMLGGSWIAALEADERAPASDLGRVLGRSAAFGQPVGATLRAWADRRRASRARSFEAATRRAPVLMVIPLVLCVLPSFVLLGLGPFLRSLWPHL